MFIYIYVLRFLQAEGSLCSIRDCSFGCVVDTRRRSLEGAVSLWRLPRARVPGGVQVGRRIQTPDGQVNLFQTALVRAQRHEEFTEIPMNDVIIQVVTAQ